MAKRRLNAGPRESLVRQLEQLALELKIAGSQANFDFHSFKVPANFNSKQFATSIHEFSANDEGTTVTLFGRFVQSANGHGAQYFEDAFGGRVFRYHEADQRLEEVNSDLARVMFVDEILPTGPAAESTRDRVFELLKTLENWRLSQLARGTATAFDPAHAEELMGT